MKAASYRRMTAACLAASLAAGLFLASPPIHARGIRTDGAPAAMAETAAPASAQTAAAPADAALTAAAQSSAAQERVETTDSVKVHFPVESAALDPGFGDNRAALDEIDRLFGPYRDSVELITEIKYIGSGSPDGNVDVNARMSKQRGEALAEYFLGRYPRFGSATSEKVVVGRDWKALLDMASADGNLPYRDETLALLQKIVGRVSAHGDSEANLAELKRLGGGEPYDYLLIHMFPGLRAATLYITYRAVPREAAAPQPAPEPEPAIQPEPALEPEPAAEPEEPVAEPRRNFYMDISTNMLYDLGLIPNLGIEFYLGRNWSIGADWMYSRWKSEKIGWWNYSYGGELTLRKWLGRKAKEKPLTGHHLGLYGQAYRYDFDFGGDGRLTDDWNWGAGIEYGYSLPVAKRLNIDFALGVGYAHGLSSSYTPYDSHYYVNGTKTVNYVGPTRVEITLVWLIGRGNTNAGKGKKGE